MKPGLKRVNVRIFSTRGELFMLVKPHRTGEFGAFVIGSWPMKWSRAPSGSTNGEGQYIRSHRSWVLTIQSAKLVPETVSILKARHNTLYLYLSNREISLITMQELLRVDRRIEARRKNETAHRIRVPLEK